MSDAPDPSDGVSASSDDADRLPQDPPEIPPRVRRFIWALVAFAAGSGALGTALSPYLLVEHPLVLVALNPTSHFLVLAAARAELWQVALVAVPRRMLSILATYGMGRMYGYAAVRWLEKRYPFAAPLIRYVERLYQRIGLWLVVLVPVHSMAGLAGVGRMRPRRFLAAILPGNIAFVVATLYFGDAIKAWTEPLIDYVSRHVVEATAICILLVIAQRLWARQRKSKGGDDDAPELPG